MNNVRTLRENFHLRQRDIAELLGISIASYSKKELGDVRFSLQEARVIADFFDHSIEDIFFEGKLSKIEIPDASIIPPEGSEINVPKPHESSR